MIMSETVPTLTAATGDKLAILAVGPALLRDLLREIPTDLHKAARKPGKWTIHEHAVHLTMIDEIMIGRLDLFRRQEQPVITPYQPGKDEEAGSLLEMNLEDRLAGFDGSRARLIVAFEKLTPAEWEREATHPEYVRFTPGIMLRHLMMHDHHHLYRIEELWLTRDAFFLH